MLFRLHLMGPDGASKTAIYDTETSGLTIDGQPFAEVETDCATPPSVLVSPSTPGYKSGPFKRLKIQMGLACNMACSYCLQSAHQEEKTSTLDAEAFLAGLDTWWRPVRDEGLRIEIWGGEPLLHWVKLRILVAGLRNRHPMASMLVITNGTLLTMEVAKWARQMGVHLAISHDGPGQKSVRGLDPLDIPESLEAIRWLVAEHPQHINFNCVLTPGNHRLGDIRRHLEEALGVEEVALSTEGLVQVDGGQTSPLTDADHEAIRLSLLDEMISGEALRNITITQKVRDFRLSLASRRPLSSVGQRCGMDRHHQVAVDLKGNVLTCQNTPEPEMRIGHVSAMDNVRLDTATHFSHRPGCMECPVIHLCQGACMYAGGDDWDSTCRNSFTFHAAILSGAMVHLSGMAITDIEPLR
jgi:uncharacterized protein